VAARSRALMKYDYLKNSCLAIILLLIKDKVFPTFLKAHIAEY
jgi:hypothetical protein